MKTGTIPRRRVSLQLWVYRHRLPILLSMGGVLLLLFGALAHYTSVVVARFEGHRWNLPSRIYSDMFVLRAGDGGRLSRDAQVHMSIDESGNQGKPARVDRVRAARRAGGPGADLRSIDSKGRRLRSRIRESCADDPEHAAEISRCMLVGCPTRPMS